MLTPPTDRLYKFAAIGGLVLTLAGGTGALKQYNDTGIQQAEFIGSVSKTGGVYTRFASLAREQIARNEKLKSATLRQEEREILEARNEEFRKLVPQFDKEFLDAFAEAQRQEAITRHFRRMQVIWLVLAGAAISAGGFISFLGFNTWRSRPTKER